MDIDTPTFTASSQFASQLLERSVLPIAPATDRGKVSSVTRQLQPMRRDELPASALQPVDTPWLPADAAAQSAAATSADAAAQAAVLTLPASAQLHTQECTRKLSVIHASLGYSPASPVADAVVCCCYVCIFSCCAISPACEGSLDVYWARHQPEQEHFASVRAQRDTPAASNRQRQAQTLMRHDSLACLLVDQMHPQRGGVRIIVSTESRGCRIERVDDEETKDRSSYRRTPSIQ